MAYQDCLGPLLTSESPFVPTTSSTRAGLFVASGRYSSPVGLAMSARVSAMTNASIYFASAGADFYRNI